MEYKTGDIVIFLWSDINHRDEYEVVGTSGNIYLCKNLTTEEISKLPPSLMRLSVSSIRNNKLDELGI